MIAIAQALLQDKEFKKLTDRIDMGGCPALICGVSPIHRAHTAAALRRYTGRQLLVVCSDEMEARRMGTDLQALTGEEPVKLGVRDQVFYNVDVASRQAEQERLTTLWAMAADRAPVVIATADGLMQRTLPPEQLKAAAMTIKDGGSYALEEITALLAYGGYTRCQQVEGPGQFALRGGILDFFSPAYNEPVRVEFFGDDVDSMSLFDVSTQRRTDRLTEAVILPAAETLPTMHPQGTGGLCKALQTLYGKLAKRKAPSQELLKNIAGDAKRLEEGRTLPAADRYADLIYSTFTTALDYLQPDALVFLCEPGRLREQANAVSRRNSEDLKVLIEAGVLEGSLCHFTLSWDQLCEKWEDFPVVMADSFTASRYPYDPRTLINVTAKQLPSYGGSFETAAGDIAHYKSEGYRVVVLCPDERRAQSLQEFLGDKDVSAGLDYNLTKLPAPGTCVLSLGSLTAGMEYPNLKLAVITEGQFAEPVFRRKSSRKKVSNRERINSYADLSIGDLVVHEYHGIGRYVGMVKMKIDGVDKDYVKIAYAGTDVLYVPATQLDLVAKYIGGGEDKQVRLSKMGGTDWQRAKTRAKGAAKEMAQELIRLYAERMRLKGHAFPPDSLWQTQFEDAFGYRETEDQLKCIEEIKQDMEKPVPMDRLLCGDVGYGKTEVALRAVMKCVMGNCQAAILVPTTVLAQQHYVTAMRRFAGYGVEIEVLNRFRSPGEVKTILRKLEAGQIDLVIGTHRLLQKDIRFKRLGLLIVDEEQRFGVTHKERLKELARQVDVLTLSATPIPRTLNMAMSGIRDMSTIEEPPHDRQPVQTYVMEHDWAVVADAIRREIARGGQVYYLHNRVESIESTAVKIQNLVDGVTVAVAHGKMDQDSLNDAMERVAAGEVQVLVCTTIIETGIDIPNVNTLIIEDADRLGLAQLHQIRGRVGRSSRRAYAYLTFRQGKVLNEVAEKRLSAIREFAEFNSGFKIAMRDLEIRGAGNLLGAEQSGHMMSVGYDMYLKLLEEAVLEEQGKKPEKKAECSADLAVNANIPETYIPAAEQRMDVYRRIALIRNEEESDEMISELIDRYGDPPSQVVALVNIALLRCDAAKAGIVDIAQKAGRLCFKLEQFDVASFSALYAMPAYKNALKVEPNAKEPVVTLRLQRSRPLEEATAFVKAYTNCKAAHEAVNIKQ